MEFKSIVKLEITKNNKTFALELPHGTPIGEAYDAVHQILEGVVRMAAQEAARIKPQDITEVHPEPVAEENKEQVHVNQE